MADVLIPPWVLPVTPETLQRVDDASVEFPPAFGRGMTQRGSWADPRWGLKRRYQALRNEELASISNVLNEARGKFNKILATMHTPRRGSMPAPEMITNNTFASGTTGFTSSSEYTLTVRDRVLRATRNAVTATQYMVQPSSEITVVQSAPYVLRAFIAAAMGTAYGLANAWRLDDNSASISVQGSLQSGLGMFLQTFVAEDTSMLPAVLDANSTGLLAGNSVTIPYLSLTRCAFADNGGNVLLQSDDQTNAAWTKTKSSATANATVAPDGTSTADFIKEDNTSGEHFVLQTVTGFGAAAADFTLCVAVKPNGRNFCEIGIQENTGSTVCEQYFNIGAGVGAVGTNGATGANWANRRAAISDLGNGWYLCCVTGRKTNAATSMSWYVQVASADGTDSYLGNNTSGIYMWRATGADRRTPQRLVQTTTVAIGATAQGGSSIEVKGLPASTNGLLEVGDWFEVAAQLKQCTAPLNSNGAGLGTLQFRPALASAGTAFDDPIIFTDPMGRFLLPGGALDFENQYGLYGEAEVDLLEVYA